MTKELKFNEKKHMYKIGDKELMSVTTFLSQYFEPFDVDKIAKFKAMLSRKRGIKGEGVRFWKAKWKKVAEDGTQTHKELEDYANSNKYRQYDLLKECSVKAFNGALWFDENILPLLQDGVTLHPELRVYDEELGLAGTIDLAVIRGNRVKLYDYKTNEKIHDKGYKGKKCKEPIGDLDDCSLVKYTLQLSLYAHMLERQGYIVETLTLVHLTPEGAYGMPILNRRDIIQRLFK